MGHFSASGDVLGEDAAGAGALVHVSDSEHETLLKVVLGPYLDHRNRHRDVGLVGDGDLEFTVAERVAVVGGVWRDDLVNSHLKACRDGIGRTARGSTDRSCPNGGASPLLRERRLGGVVPAIRNSQDLLGKLARLVLGSNSLCCLEHEHALVLLAPEKVRFALLNRALVPDVEEHHLVTRVATHHLKRLNDKGAAALGWQGHRLHPWHKLSDGTISYCGMGSDGHFIFSAQKTYKNFIDMTKVPIFMHIHTSNKMNNQ